MLFLTNPRKKRGRRRAARGKAKGSKMAAGRTAKGRIKKGYKLTRGGRVVKAGTTHRRRKVKHNPAKKHRRRTTRRATHNPRRATVAKRRKRRAPVRHRRKHYRRNPRRMKLSPKGIVNDLTKGAVGAFQVLAGKAAARVIPDQLGLSAAGPTGIATQAGVAVVVGILAKQVFGAKAGEMFMVGALTAPVESIIVTANVPVLSTALSAYPTYSALSAYVAPKAMLPAGADVSLGQYDYIYEGQQ